jgi:hypothetical protein
MDGAHASCSSRETWRPSKTILDCCPSRRGTACVRTARATESSGACHGAISATGQRGGAACLRPSFASRDPSPLCARVGWPGRCTAPAASEKLPAWPHRRPGCAVESAGPQHRPSNLEKPHRLATSPSSLCTSRLVRIAAPRRPPPKEPLRNTPSGHIASVPIPFHPLHATPPGVAPASWFHPLHATPPGVAPASCWCPLRHSTAEFRARHVTATSHPLTRLPGFGHGPRLTSFHLEICALL